MSVKITELPILDSLADNDIVAGVDVSGNTTSKIELGTLKNYIDTNTQYTAGTNIDITNNVISAPDVPTKEEFDSLSTIFNAFPTESDEDESMTLDGTAEVKFRKFDLKGNTSQTGTPTPSSPIAVNVVSGDNEINICGKNLFIPTSKVDDTNISVTRCTVSLSGDEYTFSATGNDMYFGNIVSSGTSYQNIFGTLYDVEGVTNLVFKPTNSNFDKNFVCYYDKNKVSLGYVQINNSTGLITPVTNTKYIGFRIGKNASVSGTTYTTKFQLEKGNQATNFEPYQGNTYNIDLPVENLFNKETAQLNVGINTSNGNTYNDSNLFSSDYIPISINTPYVANSASTTGNRVFGACYDSNKVYLGAVSTGVGERTFTVTITNAKYVRITGQKVNIDTYQIEEGTKIHSYSPFGTTPIELCKIGSYQGYIYKDSGKWYLHKEIGKYIFGSTNLAYDSTYNRAYTNVSSIINNILIPTSNSEALNGLSNYFSILNATTFLGNTSLNGLAISSTGTLSLRNTSYTTQTDYNNWLSTNKPILYYVLSTPTNTEITYQPLIDQLNALKLATSKKGQTNISQENNDESFIIKAEAIQDLSSVLDRIELLES